MLNIMLDGLFILNVYKTGIAVFFVTGFGLGFFIIRHLTNDEMDPGIKLLASISIGGIALCVISYILVWVAHLLPFLLRPASFLVLFFALFVIIRGIWLGEFKKVFNPRLMAAGIALFLLLIARLSFLKHIILPSYSDSPIHYQIVSDLLHPGTGSTIKLSLANIFTQYYHFGFHSLTAWLASITGIAPADAISLVGQLFLVITPISIIFLTYFVTKNVDGALFAGLMAATGWFMPAFAVNWGKFPALSSLAVMPALLAFLGYYLTGNTKKTPALLISLVLLGGVTLLHTRIIISVFLAVVSIFLSSKLQTADELGFFQSIRLSVLFIISLWPVYQLILDFYSGIPTLIIWLILLPFAFMAYPRLAVAIFFYTLGSWLIALVPPLLIENSPSLLDRQFLEIMLYIPFSIMGGAGFVGLMRKLPSKGITRRLTALTLSGCAVFIFLQGYSLLPDECCVYFKESDKLAFEWIQKNTSADTLFIISTFNENGQIIGTDAGIWIYPLTGRNTNKLRYDTNWDSVEEMKNICLSSANDIYIYMGGGRYSFYNSQLASGKWTSPVYTNGGSVLYQPIGCSK
jgi:hypothetical protein